MLEGSEPTPSSDGGHLLASRSAQALLFGAGFVTFVNSVVSRLDGVNTETLRVTGIATMAAAFVVAKLPWKNHGRLAAYTVIAVAIAALVVTDRWHHFSRNESAIAVYPVFFIVIIAWTGLTQPRGRATFVAIPAGAALAWILYQGGHTSAAWQCVAVTVPAAAVMGEVIAWAYGNAIMLGRLDAGRRAALEALVSGASGLQGALTAQESEAILLRTASAMFGGRDTRFRPADPIIDDGPGTGDTRYDPDTRELHINLRGQAGILGVLTTVIDQPDAFLLDAARLYGQHVGTRLEQLRVIDALTDAAIHDVLTGLGNRRAAQASIESLEPGDAVFLLDLDHFKKVNDSLGHQTGDQILTQFGEYLSVATRATDVVSRYGGEEFLLVSRAAPPEVADAIARRLLDGWRAQRPLVTFSIGYAIHAEGDGAELTIEHADSALYEAKRHGRDRAHQHEPLNTSRDA
jgi:diguanylate cyclase (GGDEF)-like protein